MPKLSVVLVILTLAYAAPAWARQATYGGPGSGPTDGISLKSPKKDCPCCEDLCASPCDGIWHPNWFPTHKPVELGRGLPEVPSKPRRTPPEDSGRRRTPPEDPSKRRTPPEDPRVSRTPPEDPTRRRTPPQEEDPVRTPSDFFRTPPESSATQWFSSLRLGLRVAPLRMTLDVESGGTFDADALSTTGSPVGSVGGGSGGIAPGPVPDPGPPPPASKPGGAFGSDSDDSDDSDVPFLIGPELAVPLKLDVTEWRPLSWLPAHTSLSLYGHVLVGEMEVFDTPLDIELFGVGLNLGAPLWSADPFLLSANIGAGGGFLRTDIGDTFGLEASAGLNGTLYVTKGIALVASLDFMGFFAPDARAWGPAANLGLNISW